MTFQEFSSYYPELPPFLQQVLSEASQCDIGAIDQLDPRLFPILTLLSCLKPMDNFDASLNRWASSRQNKQNDCAPSKDSDQIFEGLQPGKTQKVLSATVPS